MVLCLVSVVMIKTDFSPASDKVIVIQNTNSAFVVQTKQNQNILVLPKSSSAYDSKNISNTLSNNKIYSLDEIFLPNYTPSQNQTVLSLAEIYNLSKIVLPIEEQENSVMLYSSLKRNGIICYEDFSIYQISNTLTLKSVFDSKNLKAICIEYQNGIVSKNFVQIVENLTESQANKIIPNLPNNVDYLCLETYTAGAQKLLESEISFSRVLTKDNLYLSASEKALLSFQTNGGLVVSKKFVF